MLTATVGRGYSLHASHLHARHEVPTTTCGPFYSKASVVRPGAAADAAPGGATHGFRDDRDRIYGFLALPQAAQMPRLIEPTILTAKMLAMCTSILPSHYVRANGDMDILHMVQHPSARADDLSFPSWVPRWDRTVFTSSIARPSDTRLQPRATHRRRR